MKIVAIVVIGLVVAGCSRSRADGGHEGPATVPPRPADASASAGAGGGSAAKAATPFTIEFRSITKFPTCRGNQRIKVDDQGGLYQMTNDADCPAGSAWTKPYPTQPGYQLSDDERARLGTLIETSGVLDLPPVSTDPKKAPTDGHREELEIDFGGRHVVVAVEHTDVAAFSRVRQALIDLASR